MSARHDHGHAHGHAHPGAGHQHGPVAYNRAFMIGASLNMLYVVLEAGFGFASGSLALVADAGHNLSDVLGLLLAWGASWLAGREPTAGRTYGFKRATVLASLANAMILLVAVGAIAWEAMGRFSGEEPVATGTVLWVAAVGLVVNAGTAWLFAAGRHGDLNIRGVFLHMMADAGVTLGVIVAALAIRWTGWNWIDPAISLVIAAVVLVSTWGLLRDSALLALDAVPRGVDREAVRRDLLALPGVVEVHDLHIWGLSTTDTALTAHLVRTGSAPDQDLMDRLRALLHDEHRIGHHTVQFETPEMARRCPFRSDSVV